MSDQAAKVLKELELEAIAFAQKCSRARKLLEKDAGPSPAPKKGKALPEATVVHIKAKRRKAVLRKAL